MIDARAPGAPVPSNPPAAAHASASGNTSGASGNSHALSIGTPLQGGRYVIKKVLGEGGMGAALLATDKRLDNKPVVIKELLSDNSDPARFKEDERNFKQEVVTLAHLDHPLIPNVTDNFEENARYFMVQEYIDGENLEERMDRVAQPMKEREALGYASQVLDVLEYLEQQTPPIVHRDIKPANIIISDKDKRAHLVDFGIARAEVARNARRQQTAALGTPGYAPPEQYQGNADPRSDLYALGATLHHLMTNRDPRNYPPFSYAPMRTLNPQLSPDVERVIAKAVNNDITQRYQSATAMKRDIDEILLKRFGVTGNIGSYMLGTSGPITAIPFAGPGAGSFSIAPANQRARQHPSPITPLPPVAGQRGVQAPYAPGVYSPPQRRGSNIGRTFLLFLLLIVLLFAFGFGAYYYFQHRSTATGIGGTATPASGIGVTKASNGEHIGISNGAFAFDTNRISASDMNQAAQAFNAGNTSEAESLWNAAAQSDTSNAEALIYLEDQRVLDSGDPYIDIVVATMLTGDQATYTVGRDDLQGAYVAQKQYNDGDLLPNGVKVRLLIANSGSMTTFATPVAQQVVQLAKADTHFVGVMGWPFSSRVVQVLSILSNAHIPIVSQTASSDKLTGASPYFFRVAPPNTSQGVIGAHYAVTKLHATRVALFVDNSDSYSQTLAADFKKQFTQDGGSIVATEAYKVNNPGNFVHLLNDAESHNPDLIYFSGYAADASVLLTDLPTSGAFANLQVMGGDALYELGGYQSSSHAAGVRMRFTTFAYPDEWGALCAARQSFACNIPAFFSDYSSDFNPNNAHPGNPYGYTRADGDVILSYDATMTMLTAAQTMLTGSKTSLTPADLLSGLRQIHGAKAIQGVSGQISFDSQGNPTNKALVILKIVQGGFIQIDSVQGCFKVGAC
ncbi:MAG: hypothetical protein NVS3B14_13830 [Ktedonobacteraceae bacterium]